MKVNTINTINYSNNNLKTKTKNNSNISTIQNYQADTVSFGAYEGIKNKRERMKMAHLIIHGASGSAFATAAALAQLPGADEIPLTAITTTMVGALLKGLYGVPVMSSLVGSASACAIGANLGTGWWRHTISWIPGLGNYVSAATTTTLHEATGWTIVALGESLMESEGKVDPERKFTMAEFKAMYKKAEELKKQTQNENKGASFKGISSQATPRKILTTHTIAIDTAQINVSDNRPIKSLTNDICNLYNIDKSSKTARSVEGFFKKVKEHTRSQLRQKLEQDEFSKGIFTDTVLTAHYWLVAAHLQNAQKQHCNINNLKINDKLLASKENQLRALQLMAV